jgi:Flp pilus assembly protein TadD
VAAAALAACAVLTWRLARIYEGSGTFWGAFAQANKPAMEEYNRGCALADSGRDDEALPCFRRAIERQPAFGLAYDRAGEILLRRGQIEEALTDLREAAELRPDRGQPQYDLGLALLAKGRAGEALDALERAARIETNNPLFQREMGTVLLQNRLADDAVFYLRRAVALAATDVGARHDLACALELAGRPREAISQYEKALELRPDFPRAANNLAWILATAPDGSLRDGRKALALARGLGPEAEGNAVMLGTLAAACAETGQFAEAVATVRRARQLAFSQSNQSLAARLEAQERQYEKGEPFRDASSAPGK